MPGAKFPSAYRRVFHDIAAKLMVERPLELRVRIPSMKPIYARATFNYFRQSWLRQYQFLKKEGDKEGAQRSFDTYQRLQEYEVRIDGDELRFSSKTQEEPVFFETVGAVAVQPQLFDFDYQPPSESALRALLGSKSTELPEQIIDDNLPIIPPSISPPKDPK